MNYSGKNPHLSKLKKKINLQILHKAKSKQGMLFDRRHEVTVQLRQDV